MATAPAVPQVSVDEYERTPAFFERHEYVDGWVIEKALPTRKHSLMQGWLSVLFYKYYASHVHGPELHSKVASFAWRIPNFAVQTPEVAQNEKYAFSPLLLAIEIRSPEDRWSDIFEKFEDYHEWGVPFCWLLDPENERAWTFHRGADLYEAATQATIEAGKISLSLPEVFFVLHRK